MDDLDVIKAKISIVDLISEYLPLKKNGVNFKANCPFHNEKTPSFVVSPERGIWHCFGCFPPGELVKTPLGYHNIEEIDENHWVVSGKGKIRKVTDVMVHQYKGNLINIRLRKLGGNVRLTADHNVFVVRGAEYTRRYKDFSKRIRKYLAIKETDPTKYQFLIQKSFPLEKIPSDQLQVGDKLLYPIDRMVEDVETLDLSTYLTKSTNLGPVPKIIPLQVPVDEDFLKLIGYWIAEGSNHRAYIRFSLGNHEEDFAKEIVSLIKKIFGLEAKIYRRRSSVKTGIEITACHSQLANIFENLSGKGAENKHIPFIFQQLPIEKQKVLLEAIWKGDGTSFIPNRSRNISYSISTISKVLAEQLVDILLRLGHFPSKIVRAESVDKNLVNHKTSYRIFWLKDSLERYNLSYFGEDDIEYWLLPIKGIKREVYSGPVHNFTVDQDHSYIATNFAVGNCDKGGDIFKFLMEKEGLTFPEALETLAQKAGVTLKGSSDKKNTNEKLYQANTKAAQFFNYLLTSHSLGKKALEYLKKRGLTDETIKTFQIGYAPKNWEALSKFLRKRGFSNKELIDSGLAISSTKGCYDRFRGRVVFPLVDLRDRVIGFSGRVLDSSVPKYINTPQTQIFDKGRFLFGLNLAKGAIREKKQAVLVEGPMDMILSFQVGVKNIVATQGTSLTQSQIELLQKQTEVLNLCFDADLAGDEAVRRGIEIAERAGFNLRVVKLEGGKDPGEIILKDTDLWQKASEEAVPIYDYYLSSLEKRYDLKSSFEKRKALAEVLPIWRKIPDNVTKGFYIERLAALLQVKEDLVREEVNKPISAAWKEQSSQRVTDQPKKEELPDRRKLLEEYLISLLLHLPLDYTYIPSFPETLLTQENLRQIYVLLVIFLDNISFKSKSFKISEFVKTLPEELTPLADRLYLMQIDDKLINSSHWQKEVDAVISELKKMLIKSSLEKLSLEIKNAQSFEKVETLETLNKRFRDLSVKLKSL